MEKGTEFFDAWIKSQKDFMGNWVKAQKEFMENWTAGTKKIQESIASMGGTQEGPAKEFFNQYNTWMNTMISSSKVFTDEATKMQEAWVNSVEKQMDLLKNFSPDLFKQAGTKK
ncbi:MAG: hypothetical protein Q7T53_12240 [Deltaproteobacteria bacterium]|nr:hypothetical protein [Deltaproteobacteria bacterium]